MSGTILITGAAGFAGGHLLDRLSETGGDIVAWVRGTGARTVRAPVPRTV